MPTYNGYICLLKPMSLTLALHSVSAHACTGTSIRSGASTSSSSSRRPIL